MIIPIFTGNTFIPIYIPDSDDGDSTPMTDEECEIAVRVCVLLFSFVGGLVYFMW